MAKWKRRDRLLLLCAFVLLIPLCIRAAGIQPDPAPRPAATATAAVTPPEPSTAETAAHAQPTATEAPAFAETPATAEPSAPAEPQSDWSYQNSRVGVTITRHKQDGFVYFVADIQLAEPGQFSYAFSNEKFGGQPEALSDIAERHYPVIAVNGDFYGAHNNGIIIRGGELFRKKNSTRALLIVDKNGDLSLLTDRSEKQGLVADRLIDEGALHTFEFGPALVDGGQPLKLESTILRVADEHLEPRTAIGQLGPLRYAVVVVDGRSKGYSDGCNLRQLQQIFVDLGASVAFNLDGGGSTTLWFNGEILNQPAAGDERKVSDIVMFMP